MGIDVTGTRADRAEVNGGRRRFMRRVGQGAAMVTGLQMVSACKDDVVGAEAVPTVPRAAATPPPTYTATDTDRLNFALQLHYLLSAYLQAGVYGTILPSALATGTGAAGAVKGGTRMTFGDPVLTAQMREVANNTLAHLSLLRRLIGSDVTAQPAIDITGGAGGPFQAIARLSTTTPTPTPTPTPSPAAPPFDPYTSEAHFLLGAVALSAVVSSAMADMARRLATTLATQVTAMTSAAGARDAVVRAALYKAAFAEDLLPEDERGDPSLFGLADNFSNTRDAYDGSGDLDRGLGAPWYAEILPQDGDHNALRRTPEQALGVLYASAASVASGAFFPAGVNGAIRISGANSLS